MDKILSQINEIYSQILEVKSIIQEQDNNPHLFGGASCNFKGGPQDHAKLGRNEWFVKNAWDISGAEGTKVYSLSDATIKSVISREYNKERGEYGYSIEMQTPNDKIYYTHLSSVAPKIKQGQKIVQGELVGTIGKPAQDPEWPTHVHIALEKGDIRNLMDGYCNISVKKGDGKTSIGKTSGDTEYFYGNKDFAQLVLGDKVQLESYIKRQTNLNEVLLMAPVPIKPGFKGNFGEKRSYGSHPGTDIPIPSGTPVKAPLSGKVVSVKSDQPPCGGTIDIEYTDGLWSRFCHMKQIKVQEGDFVNRGDVVGLSGGGKNDYGRGRSTGPHLHFTLKKNGRNVDPADFMEKFDVEDITFDSEAEKEIEDLSGMTSSDSAKDKNPDFFYDNQEWAKLLSGPMNVIQNEGEVTEEKIYGDFGKDQQTRYGSVTLPKDKNEKIKSPVSGIISKGKYNPSCKNQTSISHEVDGESFTLEYCGISRVDVKVGQKVSKGTILGKTDNDVVISLFDNSGSRVYIDNYIKKEIDKTKTLTKKGIKNEPKFFYNNAWGRILGNILATPIKWFEDKYDESGKLVQKRFSSPTEKIQSDDWLSQGSPTYSKKLKEQVQKMKKML